MNSKTTVMIVDNSWIVRHGIKNALIENENIVIISEAGSNKELIHNISIEQPNIILLEIELSDGLCFNTIELIKKNYSGIGIIVLSHYKNVSNIVKSVKSGANAYLSKDCIPDELILAIKMVKKGKGLFFSGSISPEILSKCFTGTLHAKNCRPYNLTDREIELIELLAKGYQTKEIASIMSIHNHTVESHKENIKQKLGKNTAIEIVLFAYCNGIINQ